MFFLALWTDSELHTWEHGLRSQPAWVGVLHTSNSERWILGFSFLISIMDMIAVPLVYGTCGHQMKVEHIRHILKLLLLLCVIVVFIIIIIIMPIYQQQPCLISAGFFGQGDLPVWSMKKIWETSGLRAESSWSLLMLSWSTGLSSGLETWYLHCDLSSW